MWRKCRIVYITQSVSIQTLRDVSSNWSPRLLCGDNPQWKKKTRRYKFEVHDSPFFMQFYSNLLFYDKVARRTRREQFNLDRYRAIDSFAFFRNSLCEVFAVISTELLKIIQSGIENIDNWNYSGEKLVLSHLLLASQLNLVF